MPDPRAVPDSEVLERLLAAYHANAHPEEEQKAIDLWANDLGDDSQHNHHPTALRAVGLRWDGTQYLDIEGSPE